ncbi:MAG: SAM-dependent methyltransferase [Candidatus Marinamargulisbacteria bacterium]
MMLGTLRTRVPSLLMRSAPSGARGVADWSKIHDIELAKLRHAKRVAPCSSNWTNIHCITQVPIKDPLILNVGSGDGQFEAVAAPRMPSGRFVSVDASQAALDTGRLAAEHTGVSDRVTQVLSTAESINWRSFGEKPAVVNLDMILQYLRPGARSRVIEAAKEHVADYGLICIRALHTGSEYHDAIKLLWPQANEAHSFEKGDDYRHFFTMPELEANFPGYRSVAKLQTEFVPTVYGVEKYMKSALLIVQKIPEFVSVMDEDKLVDFGVPRMSFLKYFKEMPEEPRKALLLGHTNEVAQALESRTEFSFDIDRSGYEHSLPAKTYDFISLTLDPTHRDWMKYQDAMSSGRFQSMINGALAPGGFVSLNLTRNSRMDPAVVSKDWLLRTFDCAGKQAPNKFLFYANGFHYRPNSEHPVDDPHRVLRMAYKSKAIPNNKSVVSGLTSGFSLPQIEASTGPIQTAIPGVSIQKDFLTKNQHGKLSAFTTYLQVQVNKKTDADTDLVQTLHRSTKQTGYRNVHIPPPGASDAADLTCEVFENYAVQSHRLVYFVGNDNIPEIFMPYLGGLVQQALFDDHPDTPFDRPRQWTDYRWRVTVNYYGDKDPSDAHFERAGFPYHVDIKTNGQHTFAISLDPGLMEFIKPDKPVDGLVSQSDIDAAVAKRQPEQVFSDRNSLLTMSGQGRHDWAHRVVPNTDAFRIGDRIIPVGPRVSIIFGVQ